MLNPSMNKDKTCYYCGKPGHTKPECRKRAADLKRAEESKKPQAAMIEPQGEPASSSSQPVSTLVIGGQNGYVAGLPLEDQANIIGSMATSEKRIMVDSGSAAHVFPQQFDEHAKSVGQSNIRLTTVTGETVSMSEIKESIWELDSGDQLRMCSTPNVRVLSFRS